MGQSPSSSDGGAGAGAAAERKTSYYTLLGVDRSATDDEIKKAYRRKALALHPDRNYGNEAEATQTFAEVQSAYEVLADAQERAWYDSHESAILRGGDRPGDGRRSAPVYRGVKLTSADELAAIIGQFNRNVEFSDAPSGFFGFLRDTFEHLAREEEAAGDGEGAEPREYPTFGHQDDHDADVVRRFYAAWSGFTTVKSFSWCDQHRVSEAPDRFTRRRMEQENAKCRRDARSEFNEAVRSLVRLVKKRDPRVVPNTQSDEERQKALRDAAAAQRQRAREANAAKMGAVPEWSQARHDEEDELEGTFSESEGEGEVVPCVACNKRFKSEKQMHAHERSKKHQKATQELHRRMRRQNAHLGLDEEEPALGSGAVTPPGDGDGEADVPSDDVAAASDDHDAAGSCAEEEADDDEPASPPPPTRTTRDETQPPDATPHEPTTPQPAETNPSEWEDDDDDGEHASRATIAARLPSPVRASPTPAHDASENGSCSSEPATAPKSGKAAQKRARKAAAAAAAAASGAEAGGHHCHGCDAAFASKTKLFDHLTSQPTHARPQPVAAGRAPGRKAGKKKKK